MAVKRNSKIFRRLKILNDLKKVTNETKKNPNESETGSEIDTKKQIKYGTKSQAVWGIFAEYCDSSTIHGIKYLGEQKRPLLERIFWIFVFILSIYCCAMLSVNIWNKWHNNPVIVSFAEKTTPVWEIPFPAVTVCSEKSVRDIAKYELINIARKLENKTVTKKEINIIDGHIQLCDLPILLKSTPHKDYPFNKASGLIKELHDAESCLYMKWSREEETSCGVFRKVLTEGGVCFTFNNFDLKEIYRKEALLPEFYLKNIRHPAHAYPYNDTIEWTLDNGYSPNASSDTFPRRVLTNTAKDRLFFIVGDFYQEAIRCGVRTPGFKIVLHTPGEIASVSEQYIPIAFKQSVRISINPVLITTSEGLKNYDPMRRFCYFQNERYLRYFKVYTQSNCKLECLSNFTLSRCGCVKFSMPRTKKTLVCGLGRIGCMHSAENELVANEFNLTLGQPMQGVSNVTSCNCLPDCTSISYNAEISQGYEDYAVPTINTLQSAEVAIFFKKEQFLKLERSELYGTTDFLANCGGLLGLFMGVSTLSIAELVYFCSVRLVTNLKMRRQKRLELNRRRIEGDIELEA